MLGDKLRDLLSRAGSHFEPRDSTGSVGIDGMIRRVGFALPCITIVGKLENEPTLGLPNRLISPGSLQCL